MARKYITIQGDTWDLIAYKLYGDEKHMKCLIEANWSYINIMQFSAGTVLNVPDLPKDIDENAPFWRKAPKSTLSDSQTLEVGDE